MVGVGGRGSREFNGEERLAQGPEWSEYMHTDTLLAEVIAHL